MAKQLWGGTHGIDDPSRATFPFVGASGSIDAGHETAIFLTGDATMLLKDDLAEQIHGVGVPPLKDLMAKVVQNNVPIYL